MPSSSGALVRADGGGMGRVGEVPDEHAAQSATRPARAHARNHPERAAGPSAAPSARPSERPRDRSPARPARWPERSPARSLGSSRARSSEQRSGREESTCVGSAAPRVPPRAGSVRCGRASSERFFESGTWRRSSAFGPPRACGSLDAHEISNVTRVETKMPAPCEVGTPRPRDPRRALATTTDEIHTL